MTAISRQLSAFGNMKRSLPDVSGRDLLLPLIIPRLESGEDFLDFLGFMEGTQAAGANLDFDRLAFTHQGLLVDVGHEPGLGVAV